MSDSNTKGRPEKRLSMHPDKMNKVIDDLDSATVQANRTPLDFRTELKDFEPCGSHDDRDTITMPVYLKWSLESLARLAGRRYPISYAALWALDVGMTRLASMAEIRAICEARDEILRVGSSTDLEKFSAWRLEVSPRGTGTTRLNLRLVSQTTLTRSMEYHEGLGLPRSTVDCLAVPPVPSPRIQWQDVTTDKEKP